MTSWFKDNIFFLPLFWIQHPNTTPHPGNRLVEIEGFYFQSFYLGYCHFHVPNMGIVYLILYSHFDLCSTVYQTPPNFMRLQYYSSSSILSASHGTVVPQDIEMEDLIQSHHKAFFMASLIASVCNNCILFNYLACFLIL